MDKPTRILNAALNVIIEEGLERTPISKIADKAEVGIGTIYKYFKNKDDIINGIYVRIKEEEAEMIFVNNGHNPSVKETFYDYYGRMIDYFLQHPMKFNFISQYAFSPIVNSDTQKKAMSRFHYFDALYEKGHAEGLFKEIEASHLTFFVFTSIAYWLKAAKEMKIIIDDKYKNVLLQMAWDSIKK
ncbi:TetR/AcrR family transcriptional regulator [Joostella sp.]|uniref:TetR/AcrR family transcriptional regulator n=1 Tax=Joostella sp. TaxID=2231138 RepID=UPI003A93276D